MAYGRGGRSSRRDRAGVFAKGLARAPTLGETMALEQRRRGQPPLRADRGAGGGADRALRSSTRPARAHPFVHPLPLVAECCLRSKAIQTDLVLHAISSGFLAPCRGWRRCRQYPVPLLSFQGASGSVLLQ